MKSWWWYQPGRWCGLLPSTGGDEYGRHTVVIPTLIFGTFVFATKPCDCEDMVEFRCITPGCPWIAITTDAKCLVCDPYEEDAA